MVVLELLTNKDVLMNLKRVLFPQSLSDRVDCLKERIDDLTAVIEPKNARVNELETSISTMETKLDALDYSRRFKLRFQSIKTNGGASRSENH